MPSIIAAILQSRAFLLLARVELTFVFWSSGLVKLFGFDSALLEMEKYQLQPAWLYAAATVIVQLGGSLAIILNRGVWLGTGALAVFTLLTIPIAHAFWTKTGDEAVQHMVISFEHISMVGGLALAAILSKKTALERLSSPSPSAPDESRALDLLTPPALRATSPSE